MWQSWRDNESFNNRKFLFMQFYFIQSKLTGEKLRLTVLVVVGMNGVIWQILFTI